MKNRRLYNGICYLPVINRSLVIAQWRCLSRSLVRPWWRH